MRPVTVSTTGIGAALASPPVPLDQYLTPFQVTLQCTVNGAATYSVEWTSDDIWAPGWSPLTANWFAAAANLTGAVDAEAGSLVSPVSAVRIRQTAGGGTATMVVRQAGAAS